MHQDRDEKIDKKSHLCSEAGPLGPCHIILKMRRIVENQPLSLACKMVENDPLVCWYLAQVKIFNIGPLCMGRGATCASGARLEAAHPNVKHALDLLADEAIRQTTERDRDPKTYY